MLLQLGRHHARYSSLPYLSYPTTHKIRIAFDPQLLGNLYAMPAFQKDFGYAYEDGYLISAAWQTGLGMGNPIGQVVGALAAGYPMEWYGRKKTFNACVFAIAGLVFIQFFARSLPVLLAGELLAGLVLGAFVVIAPAYASEVNPLAMRSVSTSYVNLCFVTGQLLGNGVTAATQHMSSHWAYSIPFSLQWFWVLVILPGMWFAPERYVYHDQTELEERYIDVYLQPMVARSTRTA